MNQSIESLLGKLIIAGFRGTDAPPSSPIAKFIQNYDLAGVILYDVDTGLGNLGSLNIQSPEQVLKLTNQLQSYANDGLLISIDQEGGQVNRLQIEYGFPACPSWNSIGNQNDNNVTKDFAKTMAQNLQRHGINLNYAPVLDLDYGETSIISHAERCFSSDPKKVANHAQLFIDSLKKQGIISCGKHFPGQGSATDDTHKSYTDMSKTWTKKDVLPFDSVIQSGDLDMIMIAHTFDSKLDSEYPASMSKKIISDYLRDDLGFSGVIICDDPSMKAISDHYSLEETFEQMLNAGVDLFCLGNNLNYDPNYIPNCMKALRNIVSDGKVKKSRIHDAIQRIDVLKRKFNIHG